MSASPCESEGKDRRDELPTPETVASHKLLPSKVQVLTKNHSTWLKLPEEREGPHLRRAVLPTSASTRSGMGGGCFSSPGTPGEWEGQAQAALSTPAALSSPLPSPGSLQLFHWKGLERALPLLTLNFTMPTAPTWVRPLPVEYGVEHRQGDWVLS